MTTQTRKRGRPPLERDGRNADGRSPEISLSLAPSTLAELQTIASAREMTVGAVIRVALGAFLRTRQHTPDAVAPPPAHAPDPSVAAQRISRRVARRGAI